MSERSWVQLPAEETIFIAPRVTVACRLIAVAKTYCFIEQKLFQKVKTLSVFVMCKFIHISMKNKLRIDKESEKNN